MVRLKTLDLERCFNLEELRIVSRVGMEEHTVNLFTTLETFNMDGMLKFKIVLDVPPRSRFCFANLKYVSIRRCPKLKEITWLIYAPNLETLYLEDLSELEEVISDGFAAEEKLKTTFSRLDSLSFNSIPKLKRICNHNVNVFSLERILVNGCPELKKLMFNTNTVILQTLKKIEGEKQWWESLEWEDETTKSNLAQICIGSASCTRSMIYFFSNSNSHLYLNLLCTHY